ARPRTCVRSACHLEQIEASRFLSSPCPTNSTSSRLTYLKASTLGCLTTRALVSFKSRSSPAQTCFSHTYPKTSRRRQRLPPDFLRQPISGLPAESRQGRRRNGG